MAMVREDKDQMVMALAVALEEVEEATEAQVALVVATYLAVAVILMVRIIS